MSIAVNVFNDQKREIGLVGIRQLARKIWKAESRLSARLDVILVDLDGIRALNREYLDLDATTDVLAFELNHGERGDFEGEIYVCVDEVMDNAKKLDIEPKVELKRMVTHGVLHFLGYRDKSSSEKETMTQREDYYLAL